MNRETVFSFLRSRNFQPLEGYADFLKRVFAFQHSKFSFGTENFVPSDSVRSKVDENNAFRDFFGDTIVFNLTHEQKQLINEHFIEPLYQVAPHCLAERLQEKTLHMTLHDLNAKNWCDESFLKDMFDTEIILSEIIRQANIQSRTITMTTTFVFNMVNTSLVLGLVPKTDHDHYNLMSLYSLIDSIFPLPYPFTPHITLAYYNHHGFEGEPLRVLQNTVNELNKQRFDIELSTDMLFYQKFISMNDYFNIMSFTTKV